MITQLYNMQLFPAIWWWTEMSDSVLTSFLHIWLMHTNWWYNFQPTPISIPFFLIWLSLCFFFYKSELVQQHGFVRLNVSKNFQSWVFFNTYFQYLLILGTEDNTEWKEQKNEQVSCTAFTWNQNHSLGTKKINCSVTLQINWRKFFRC